MTATALAQEAKRAYARVVNAWCLYDWGNSAFSTTVEAAVLPVYFARVAGAELGGNTATVYWGYAAALSLLVSALLAPLLGSIADYTGKKKRLLGLFAGLGIVTTALLFSVDKGDWLAALILVSWAAWVSPPPPSSTIRSCRTSPNPKTSTSFHSEGYAGLSGGGLLLASTS
jgi:UMF1 family MFS transporter